MTSSSLRDLFVIAAGSVTAGPDASIAFVDEGYAVVRARNGVVGASCNCVPSGARAILTSELQQQAAETA
jgi:hypothetical protein